MSSFEITQGEVDAALCVWEWVLTIDHNKPKDKLEKTIVQLFEDNGTAEMRSLAITVGRIVEECWLRIGEDERDTQVFDWDFVPMICRHIDWSEVYYKDKQMVDIDRLIAVVQATQALGV